MELKIYSPSEDGFIKKIDWNYEEIKKEVAEKVKHYASLVYTEDQIKLAKTDRANLRKFIDALETKRKEIKKQCLAPYEDFEKQMKEIVSIVNEPVSIIDSQIKEVEEQKKQEKLEEVKKLWAECVDFLKLPEWVTFEQIFNQKWLNASTSITTIQNEMENIGSKITTDLITIGNLTNFHFEAHEVYKTTLDINKAIQEGQRLFELQKKKEEYEAEQKPTATEQVSDQIKEEPEAKQWVSFAAHLTRKEALELKGFFIAKKIEFKAI